MTVGDFNRRGKQDRRLPIKPVTMCQSFSAQAPAVSAAATNFSRATDLLGGGWWISDGDGIQDLAVLTNPATRLHP